MFIKFLVVFIKRKRDRAGWLTPKLFQHKLSRTMYGTSIITIKLCKRMWSEYDSVQRPKWHAHIWFIDHCPYKVKTLVTFQDVQTIEHA